MGQCLVTHLRVYCRRGRLSRKDVSTVSNPRLCTEFHWLWCGQARQQLVRNLQVHGSAAIHNCVLGEVRFRFYAYNSVKLWSIQYKERYSSHKEGSGQMCFENKMCLIDMTEFVLKYIIPISSYLLAHGHPLRIILAFHMFGHVYWRKHEL